MPPTPKLADGFEDQRPVAARARLDRGDLAAALERGVLNGAQRPAACAAAVGVRPHTPGLTSARAHIIFLSCTLSDSARLGGDRLHMKRDLKPVSRWVSSP